MCGMFVADLYYKAHVGVCLTLGIRDEVVPGTRIPHGPCGPLSVIEVHDVLLKSLPPRAQHYPGRLHQQ